MGKTIYLRTDADSDIGYGHFVRSLALANILKQRFTCKFVTVKPTEYQICEMQKVGEYIALPSRQSHFDDFYDILEKDSIVVLDNYFYDVDYQKRIKEKQISLVYVDDRKSIKYYCDAVINHVIGIKPIDIINLLPNTSLYLGTDYALLRPSFIEGMKKKAFLPNNNRVLVAMGGTDYNNYTAILAEFLLNNTNYEIEVLIGDAYKYTSTLERLNPNRIFIHKNLSEDEIVKLLKNVSLVVSPPSTFAYEVCSIGRPLIVGSFAPGHSDVATLLSEYGLAENIGSLSDLTSQIFLDTLLKVVSNMDYYIQNQKNRFNGSQEQKILDIFNKLLV